MPKRQPYQQAPRERERSLEGVRELDYGRPSGGPRRLPIKALIVLFLLGLIGGAIAYHTLVGF